MKNYNAKKISLTNFLCDFAGGYTESLACSQFLVGNNLYQIVLLAKARV